MPRHIRIGLLVPHGFAYYRGVIRGVLSYAGGRPDWLVDSLPPGRGPGWPTGAATPDGLIAAVNTPAVADLVSGWRGPLVNVSAVLPGLPYPAVRVDNRTVARAAADHFRGLGLTRFGFVGYRGMMVSDEREDGFRAELAAGGFDLRCYHDRPDRAFDPHAQLWPLDRGVGRWLAGLPKPAGVLAVFDLWGLRVVNGCRAAGVRVPDEVAVLGVDDDDLHCEASRPPLSSVRLPTTQVGYEAAALLDRLLAGHPPPAGPVLLPAGEVSARRSTEVLAVDDPVAAAAARHIRDHALEGLTVDAVFARLTVGRRSAERRFRRVFGRGVQDEIRRVQLAHARQLLAATDLPVKQVAARCGFTDGHHLAVVFHKRAGMTPSEYRAANRRPA